MSLRITIPGIGGDLAAAIRRISAIRQSLPEADRPNMSVEAWHQLEAELSRACAMFNRDDAVSAIARWERSAMATLDGRNGKGER